MENAKHTPAPWFLDDDGSSMTINASGLYDSKSDTFSSSIAVVEVYDDSYQDALLICAAPDLLAACQVALDALDDTGKYEGTRAALRTAIEKATGGTQ